MSGDRLLPLSETQVAILERAAIRLEEAKRAVAKEEERLRELVALLADGSPATYSPGEKFLEVHGVDDEADPAPLASELESIAEPSSTSGIPVASEETARGRRRRRRG